ncbi:MAG: hypothetical protein ACLQFX_01135, partial [Acidimicrobiales bacterium]
YPFVAPANIPVTNARWAKRKTTKTGAIATKCGHRSSGRSAGLTPPPSDGLNAAVLSGRYCRPTGSGYCLSFQNIT